MIDLHCHFLPDVDDGAQTTADALALVRAAVENGIREAVLTPHVNPGRFANTLSTLQPKFEDFRRLLASEHIPLKLHLGAEIRLSTESLALLDRDELPMLGHWEGFEVVLLELPPGHLPVGAINVVGFFMKKGIVPLLAHPERNKAFMHDWRTVKPFVEAGCLLQVTAASVIGDFGPTAQLTALSLLDAGWVSIVATDAHNLVHRPPVLAQARDEITRRFGADAAQLLTELNPRRILAGNG